MATNKQLAIFADLNMKPIRKKKAEVDSKMMADVAVNLDVGDPEMPQLQMEQMSANPELPSAVLGLNGGMGPKVNLSGSQLPNNDSQEEKINILECTK